MSKLKFVTAARAATLFAAMLSLISLPVRAGDAPAADAAATAAPADPDAADAAAAAAADPDAAPADAAVDAPPEADPADTPADAKPAEPAAKPMKTPAAAPAAPQKSVEASAAAPAPAAAAAPAKDAVVAAPGPLTVGATVVGADGKEVGKINRVSAGPSGEITEIHVNTSGAAGLTGAIVAIPGGKIASGGDKVKLSLTSEEVSKLPKVGGKG